MTQPGRDVNSVDEIVVDRDLAVLESVIHDIELHDAVAADRALTNPAQVGTA